ncbi:MAG: MBL fold metallo-hydrolase [Caldilineaceae bacterium]|nr:MBL fold metallo-hydrolase [Caldilineaceae bacterium]
MATKRIVPGLYGISLGNVNAFLLEGEELTLIDTGFPGSEGKILQAVVALGKQPTDLRHIVITHCHPDHAGSLAALQQATGAAVYAHPLDAPAIRTGAVIHPPVPAPYPVQRLLYWLLIRNTSPTYAAAPVTHEIHDGDELPGTGGLKVVHAPGHSAGQVALYWPQHRGVLLAADACSNLPFLDYSIVYDDFAQGQRTLAALAKLDFAVACFGHGEAIQANAAQRFRKKWGAA